MVSTVTPFKQAVAALAQPGDLSEVVETEFGFHIIRLDKKIPAGKASFEDVRDELQAQALTTIKKKAREAAIEKIQSKGVEFNHANIEAFAKSHRPKADAQTPAAENPEPAKAQ